MYPIIFHLYGPLKIQSYGLAIVIGILVFLFFVLRHPHRERIISKDQFFDTVSGGIVAGVIGGHLLYILTQSELSFWAVIVPWHGLSILGAIVGILLFLMVYLRIKKIPLLPFLDLVAIYVPLLQSFGRIGCFFAGCCYGAPASVAWAVTYTNAQALAPLCIALHPSQLYSALLLFIIFLCMYGVLQYQFKKPGQLISCYFIMVGAERFIIDFFRFDHESLGWFGTSLGIYQWIALGIIVGGTVSFVYVTMQKTKKNKS